MARQVNFLRERHKAVSKQEQQDKQILRIGAIIFGGIFSVFLLILGITFFFQYRLNQVKNLQKAARDQITSNQETEEAFVIFVHKLQTLAKLWQDRLDKKEAISYFTQVFGPNIFLKEIEFDQEEKLLVFRIQATDIFTLKRVFEVVNEPQTQERFRSINPSALQRTRDGKYEMRIAVSVKKDS